ncbi:hypothetical protein R3P38DRAFT_3215459 [Favolaschia claudopus]|uniref:Uncharacterized protein n=1 Tax=Favolaschia claudopus TaxID=2862362 RepID=A0AAW0A9H5_9AGAR
MLSVRVAVDPVTSPSSFTPNTRPSRVGGASGWRMHVVDRFLRCLRRRTGVIVWEAIRGSEEIDSAEEEEEQGKKNGGKDDDAIVTMSALWALYANATGSTDTRACYWVCLSHLTLLRLLLADFVPVPTPLVDPPHIVSYPVHWLWPSRMERASFVRCRHRPYRGVFGGAGDAGRAAWLGPKACSAMGGQPDLSFQIVFDAQPTCESMLRRVSCHPAAAVTCRPPRLLQEGHDLVDDGARTGEEGGSLVDAATASVPAYGMSSGQEREVNIDVADA